MLVAVAWWSVSLYLWPVSLIPDHCIDSAGVTLSVFQSGAVAFVAYSIFQFVIHYLLPAVSHPGGARDHKIQRIPKWEDKSTTLASFAEKWRCTVADESHDVTASKFKGTSGKITGEASGRQMWTNAPSDKKHGKAASIDDKLVSEMAAGGRDEPGTFNPTKNPNR